MVREEQSTTVRALYTRSSSENESSATPWHCRRSHCNTSAELSAIRLSDRDPTTTVRFQLRLALHNSKRHPPMAQVLSSRRHLIATAPVTFPQHWRALPASGPGHAIYIALSVLTNCMSWTLESLRRSVTCRPRF